MGEWNYFSLPILNIGLPQELQVPLIAGLPFFSLICLGFLISLFFFFSYTQYPVTNCEFPRPQFPRFDI